MPGHLWHVDRNAGRIELDRFSAVIDTSRSDFGLNDLRIDGQFFARCRVLGVELPFSDHPETLPAECYVRGGDLVATYSARQAGEIKAQVYWRVRRPPIPSCLAAIEMLASVQTDMSESWPSLNCQTELIASHALRLSDAERGTFASILPMTDHSELIDSGDYPLCYLLRFPGGRYSYAEMVHPADARLSNWEGWLDGANFRLQLRHSLFAERLEKGVILRGRVLGVVLDRDHDRDAAMEHYHSFLAEALPLTT